MIGFANRNLKIFFRDRAAVFFSLLAVFIIIGLYVLFLGDVFTSSFEEMEGVRFLMDSWIMAGLLAVSSFTTTMGAFGIMVNDKMTKISKDFNSSPIKRSSIAAGYILSSFSIGVIMSVVTFILAEIYIITSGGDLLEFIPIMKILGLILLTTFVNTSIIFFIVSFFKSENAFATASSVIGTLIGFLTGIYLPIGQLPEVVQWIIKLFPVSHGAVLFRQVMMEAPEKISFAKVPAEYINGFKETMGVTFKFGDTVITPTMSIVFLVVTAAVFFGLSILSISRKQV
jgi:multidrug/hemolysin transport system permease protein